jgi:hypothetical protein
VLPEKEARLGKTIARNRWVDGWKKIAQAWGG